MSTRLYQLRETTVVNTEEKEEEDIARYNIVLNGDFVFDQEKQTLVFFDCNMTRYFFSVTLQDKSPALRYLQLSKWDRLNSSVYFSGKKSKFICLNESYQQGFTEVIKWRTVKKRKIHLWLFMELAKKEGNKDLLKFVDFYKACTYLK